MGFTCNGGCVPPGSSDDTVVFILKSSKGDHLDTWKVPVVEADSFEKNFRNSDMMAAMKKQHKDDDLHMVRLSRVF